MSDKVNMTLDEIIKMNKTKKSEATGFKPKNIRGKFSRKGAPAGRERVRGNLARNKSARRSFESGPRTQGNMIYSGPLHAQAIEKLVNKAVRREVIRSRTVVEFASQLNPDEKPPRNIISRSARLIASSNHSRASERTTMVPQTVNQRIIRTGKPRFTAPVFSKDIGNEEMIEKAPIRVMPRPIRAKGQAIVEIIRIVPKENPRLRGQLSHAIQQVPSKRRQAGGRTQKAARVAQQQQSLREVAVSSNRRVLNTNNSQPRMVERFEPSGTFLQKNTTQQKGRGFRNY